MKTKLPILAATLFSFNILLDAPAMAVDEHGSYQTLHFISCDIYAKDRKDPPGKGRNNIDEMYVGGWLSGYNYLTPNTYDIIPNHNLDMVMVWLDNFCKANPKKNIEIGLLKLTDDLYPQRMQLNTQPGAIDPKAVASPTKK